MAGPQTAIRPSPADKRGLGISFMGMMQKETSLFSDAPTEEIEELRLRVRQQGITLKTLAAKVDYLMLPWWKRLWLFIRRKANV